MNPELQIDGIARSLETIWITVHDCCLAAEQEDRLDERLGLVLPPYTTQENANAPQG